MKGGRGFKMIRAQIFLGCFISYINTQSRPQVNVCVCVCVQVWRRRGGTTWGWGDEELGTGGGGGLAGRALWHPM